jgi:cytochrome c biogenesis protein CcmG/thiol:disulfide interchange protein DsbE
MLAQTARGRAYDVWLGLASAVLVSAGMLGLVSLLSLLAAVEVAQAASGPYGPIAAGRPAPGFTLSDLAGQSRAFQAAQGHPVILHFWATWCAPCREEMPLLQQAYDTHRRAGLIVLAISQDTADRAAGARTYWRQAGWTFTSLLDLDGVVARQYQVLFLPSTIFINAQGVVTAIHRGPLSATQLKQYLVHLMAPLG